MLPFSAKERFYFLDLACGAGARPGEPALRLPQQESETVTQPAIFNLPSLPNVDQALWFTKGYGARPCAHAGSLQVLMPMMDAGGCSERVPDLRLTSHEPQIPHSGKWTTRWPADSTPRILERSSDVSGVLWVRHGTSPRITFLLPNCSCPSISQGPYED